MNASAKTRWEAVCDRDEQADGRFFYSVRTTGVYNRPSCPARSARRENVEFFATAAAAEARGYRPCKRCAPDRPTAHERHVAAAARACRIVDERGERAPNLDDLAAAVGFSRFHFHRVFKAVVGITPHAYLSARRAQRVRDVLTEADSVTSAIYDAGFNSNGHFYATAPLMLGMTPTSFRAGGAGQTIRYLVGSWGESAALVAVAERGVCDVLVGPDPRVLPGRLRERFPMARTTPAAGDLAAAVRAALDAATAPVIGADLPPGVALTVLREQVTEALPDATSVDLPSDRLA
ncbi:bifunctional transcriptional activator/DNA repair enzyme AdaA [Actinokineospora globicatena]|uniref:bifunctional transcriptional activator/DNA repair enzyme AdaA n=1 Tax=Actinokineospora globicatena TaxID=103729 RepID=UPI0020A4DDD1|nr:Ada metal-binding domain-containing protein [Actinokineospora globicatena]MCP2306764.1 DNA-O6-methylguanine--protein-cysteine S-methyltransferase (EC 2.1.1.63)/Transcriptional regulator Ada [Actinokineospora globicatena]